MTRKGKTNRRNYRFPWLDVLALVAWGILLLKYWLTDELKLLIHPNYFALVFISGLVLIVIGIVKIWQWIDGVPAASDPANVQHITLFPPGWSTGLLLATAITALIIPPGVLGSQTALQRGITDTLPATRIQPVAFRASVKPEKRSIIDWVRTINAYPEPDDYVGQKVNVIGFVIHDDNLGEEYILISRFVLTCCAVDAYPVGLPVKLNGSRNKYPPDTWLQVEGEMVSGEVSNKRQVIIVASSIKEVPTPKDPYDY